MGSIRIIASLLLILSGLAAQAQLLQPKSSAVMNRAIEFNPNFIKSKKINTITTTTHKTMNGKESVFSKEYYQYNEAGQLMKWVEIFEDTSRVHTYTYANGLLSEYTYSDWRFGGQETTKYHYNDKGQLLKKTLYNGEGAVKDTMLYYYNSGQLTKTRGSQTNTSYTYSNGKITSEITSIKGGTTIINRYQYNQQGQEVEREITWHYTTSYYFDYAEGRIVTYAKEKDNALVQTHTFTYNANHLVTTEVIAPEMKGLTPKKVTYEYTHYGSFE